MPVKSDYVLYLKNSRLSIKLTDPPTTANPSGRFDVARFIPPTATEEAIQSESTSYNRYGGEELVSTRAKNISFTFPIIVLGSSEQRIARSISDLESLLDMAGDEYDPLYLCFKRHSYLSGEPLWGQMGAFLRYEIVNGKVHVDKYDKVRSEFVNATVQLILRPFALGQVQRLANGYGGLRQNVEGFADGQSRGVVIPQATGNSIINAAFIGRYGFFQDDGWTLAAPATSKVSEVIDGRFRFWPSESKRIYGGTGGGKYYQSVTCGNVNKWTLSAYVKKEDGSAVTAADVILWYDDVALAGTYTHMGDGLYRVHAVVNGYVAAKLVSIIVPTGKTIYLHGVQFEERPYPSPFCCGDLPGNYYSNVNLSLATSARVNGSIILPIEDASNYSRALSMSKGTIAFVWTPYNSDTEFTSFGADNDPVLLDTGPARTLMLSRDSSAHQWFILDGVNSAVSPVDAVVPGTPIVIHLVWAVGSPLKLYKNGVLAVQNPANWSPPVMPTNLFIGTANVKNLPSNGCFGDFSTYAWDMSQAEITAQYADISSRLSEGRLESPIPYILTRAGDGVIDSHNDGAGIGDHWAWALADGIAGNVPADTKFDFSHNVGALQVLISNLANREFIPPAVLGDLFNAISNAGFFQDVGQAASGTADANASGGYNKQFDITAEAYVAYGRLCALPNRLLLGDRDYIAYVRLKASQAAAMAVTIRCKYAPDTSAYDPATFQLGDPKTWSTFVGAATYTTIFSAPVHMPRFRRTDAKLVGIGFERIFWWLTLISAPASLQNVDYIGLLPRPIKMIALGTTADKRVVIHGAQVNPGASAEGSVNGFGDDISLEPGKRNIIQVVHAAYTDSDADSLAYNLTFNYIEYTPKWSLM
jgi:hypothetical protein